jgi:hypothetical protein
VRCKDKVVVIPADGMGTIHESASRALCRSGNDAGFLVRQVISPNGGIVT